jgi:mRNA interferase MazF
LSDAVSAHRHVVLAFITSAIPAMAEPTDIPPAVGTPEFAPTGLRMNSTLRLPRMVTVSTSIILRQMGVLAPSTQAQVQQRLRALFAP